MEQETKEISEETEKDNSEKNQKKDFYTEVILMLILGVLIGVAVKTEAAKRITIGSDDYKMKFFSNTYNINKLGAELAKEREAAQAVEAEGSQLTVPTEEASPAAN